MAKHHRTHAFVDGAYLRSLALRHGRPLPNPLALVLGAIGRSALKEWCYRTPDGSIVEIARLTYYDARPDESEGASPNLSSYWDAIETLNDCDLGFGSLRGRPRRQKGVDSLIAVDMLTGAFDQIFDVAVLVAGDADFVPVVQEVKRRGALVGLIGEASTTSSDLRRSVDRRYLMPTVNDDDIFPPLHNPGKGFWNAE